MEVYPSENNTSVDYKYDFQLNLGDGTDPSSFENFNIFILDGKPRKH